MLSQYSAARKYLVFCPLYEDEVLIFVHPDKDLDMYIQTPVKLTCGLDKLVLHVDTEFRLEMGQIAISWL